MSKTILKLSGVLLVITSVVALLLGIVNAMTKDIIAENMIRKTNEAMQEIVPGCMPGETIDLPDWADSAVTEAREYTQNGEYAGMFVKVTPVGFGGKIEMIVGVCADGSVGGVRITDHGETAGLGAKAADIGWLSQFGGKTEGVEVIKNAVPSGNQVQAVTSATVTSKAVTLGVNEAIEFVMKYQKEVGR